MRFVEIIFIPHNLFPVYQPYPARVAVAVLNHCLKHFLKFDKLPFRMLRARIDNPHLVINHTIKNHHMTPIFFYLIEQHAMAEAQKSVPSSASIFCSVLANSSTPSIFEISTTVRRSGIFRFLKAVFGSNSDKYMRVPYPADGLSTEVRAL